jgi:hypothetical protein
MHASLIILEQITYICVERRVGTRLLAMSVETVGSEGKKNVG